MVSAVVWTDMHLVSLSAQYGYSISRDSTQLFIAVHFFQNTTVTDGNVTYISDSVSDNPQLQFYLIIYAVSILATMIVFVGRSFLVMKVMGSAWKYL